jgi:hypothetical protein
MAIRVCVAGVSGKTGAAVARAVLTSVEFELTGAVARRSAGRDAGELLGLRTVGVVVNGTLEEALARTAPGPRCNAPSSRGIAHQAGGRPMSNVRDFGAKGDGKNYDTEAIRHAIANAADGVVKDPRSVSSGDPCSPRFPAPCPDPQSRGWPDLLPKVGQADDPSVSNI